MKLTMLGTGSALVTKYYNTCFLLEDADQYLLVDGGGGNQIFEQLAAAGLDWRHLHHVFLTHKHVDHFVGVLWLVRAACQRMKEGTFEGKLTIYGHAEVLKQLETVATMLLQPKQSAMIGQTLLLVPVADGETRTLIGHEFTFFDIHSTKTKQFGFTLQLAAGAKFTCCGDEPFSEYERDYATGSKWLTHEAFCLESESTKFHPHAKNHSTVADATRLASNLNVANLILYHTEDSHPTNRKSLYSAEGQQYYTGNLFIPEDMDSFEL